MSRHELFLEIGTEELPAHYVAPAVTQLAEQLMALMREARIEAKAPRTFATPRRLGVVFAGVASQGRDEVQALNGPPVRIAFAEDGSPKVPALKFAEKVGLPVESLQRKETPKGEYLFADVVEHGVETWAYLSEELPRLLGRLSFPKMMRWGQGDVSFARPVHWLCALYRGEPLAFSFAGIRCGKESRGHRFLAPEPFEVEDLAQYEEETRARHVMIDPVERKAWILRRGRALAASCGGCFCEDQGLLELNTYLAEEPTPLLARFEEEYLSLPQELLRASMRQHLKCFVVEDEEGGLLPYFVPVAGLRSRNEEVVREGYQRVLRARLADARFFYDEDRRRSLASRVAGLNDVVFQAQLGSYGDKVRRLKALLPALTKELGSEAHLPQTLAAAELCKADLLTGTVGEFPELQGTMGRCYALHDGEEEEVARAIEEHYLPVGQGDPLPSSIVGQALALAERLDTLVGGFAVGLKPSGSADPYGLRRQAIGSLRILKEKCLPARLGVLIDVVTTPLADKIEDHPLLVREVLAFLRGRLVQIFLRDGWPQDLVEATCVVGLIADHPLPNLENLLMELEQAVESGVLKGIAYSFKRINNILRPAAKKGLIPAYPGLGALHFQHENLEVPTQLLKEDAEIALFEVFQAVKNDVGKYLQRGLFAQAFEALLRLREPIDRLFDEVMVMDKDITLRDTRLALLRAIAQLAFLDFSRVETES